MSEYVAKPDPEGINSSTERSPVLDALILVVGFAVLIFALYWTAGFIVEKLLIKIPAEKEIEIFKKLYPPKEDAGGTDDSIKPIQLKLKENLKFPIRIQVICSQDMNAFAFPGGRIVLTSELIKKLKTENALVFVIGHEIGHFANRDHLRGLGRQIVLSLISAVTGLGGGMDYISGLGNVSMRTFQQAQEIKADEYGLDLLASVYGHYQGADEFFRVISAEETRIEKVLDTFVSTHPPSDERIAFINQRKMSEAAKANVTKPILLTEDFKKSVKCSGEF